MAVRPVLAPAHNVSKNVHALERRIERAVADDHITRAEKRGIRDHANRVERQADRLIPRQGDGVVDAVNHLQALARKGRLTLKADDVVAELIKERGALWKQAKADAKDNPFDHLRHTKAPFPGVRTRDFTMRGERVHMVAVDLNNPKVKLGVTGPDDRGRLVKDFANKRGAEVAINGDFFSLDGRYRPSGFNMKAGKAWGGKADGFEESLVFSGRHAQIIPGMGGVPDWARNAISARHLVVSGGHALSRKEMVERRPTAGEVAKIDEVAPRTAVGLSKDGRVLYLFAVDGINEPNLGRIMRSQGVHLGFVMDSGSSAQMFQKGRGAVLKGRNGSARPVANALFIQADR